MVKRVEKGKPTTTAPKKNVQNPGSTLGEAVGAMIEAELNRILGPIASACDCIYVCEGETNPLSGKPKKLLLTDSAKNQFHIDGVIVNRRGQPIVLIESKYIRYVKHNRDKGSWICTAHQSLHRTFPTIRQSIAVIAGSWSKPSKALLESFDITLFEIPFPKVVEALARHKVVYDWGEKERDKAMLAAEVWAGLTPANKAAIGRALVGPIEEELRTTLAKSLDSHAKRSIAEIDVIVKTNLGEARRYVLPSLDQTRRFVREYDPKMIHQELDGPSIPGWEEKAKGY